MPEAGSGRRFGHNPKSRVLIFGEGADRHTGRGLRNIDPLNILLECRYKGVYALLSVSFCPLNKLPPVTYSTT